MKTAFFEICPYVLEVQKDSRSLVFQLHQGNLVIPLTPELIWSNKVLIGIKFKDMEFFGELPSRIQMFLTWGKVIEV